jgi:hypothetical protein
MDARLSFTASAALSAPAKPSRCGFARDRIIEAGHGKKLAIRFEFLEVTVRQNLDPKHQIPNTKTPEKLQAPTHKRLAAGRGQKSFSKP